MLCVLCLFLLDKTKLNKYIGYKKVKEIIVYDYNFYPIVKKVFGDKIFSLYNGEVSVNNDVIKEERLNDYYLVYQSNYELYSTFIGSVNRIEKNGNYYDVYINLGNSSIVICNLEDTNLRLYQKVEANTVIGYLPFDEVGYYYYYKKY